MNRNGVRHKSEPCPTEIGIGVRQPPEYAVCILNERRAAERRKRTFKKLQKPLESFRKPPQFPVFRSGGPGRERLPEAGRAAAPAFRTVSLRDRRNQDVKERRRGPGGNDRLGGETVPGEPLSDRVVMGVAARFRGKVWYQNVPRFLDFGFLNFDLRF
jgi:hypothetical protein